jgi:hypothetical protein
MEQLKHSKYQIFEAFTKVVNNDNSPEIEVLMLDVIQNSKEKWGTNYLEEVANKGLWQQLNRFFQL